MKQSFLFPLALVTVVLILGGVYIFNQQFSVPPSPTQNADATPTIPKTSAPLPTSTPASRGYPASVVALHASATDCWTMVRGNVYDLTSWINQHPGGADAILSMCGRDATASFEAQHGGQRRPEAELASFMIGAVIPQ